MSYFSVWNHLWSGNEKQGKKWSFSKIARCQHPMSPFRIGTTPSTHHYLCHLQNELDLTSFWRWAQLWNVFFLEALLLFLLQSLFSDSSSIPWMTRHVINKDLDIAYCFLWNSKPETKGMCETKCTLDAWNRGDPSFLPSPTDSSGGNGPALESCLFIAKTWELNREKNGFLGQKNQKFCL